MLPKIRIPEAMQEQSDMYQVIIKTILNGGIPQSEYLINIIRRYFFPFIICSPSDFLSPQEIEDARASLRDIENGRAYRFETIEDALKWLHEE